ncbi:MAG: hypothetical protein AAB383_01285 [Patescibacteria group bacterium]
MTQTAEVPAEDELDLNLQEYFSLTSTIQNDSEYGAGYLNGMEPPEGYVILSNEVDAPRAFYLDGLEKEGDFIWILAEEGYEDKEVVSFYLNRVAGPRSELYGPFSADLNALLAE